MSIAGTKRVDHFHGSSPCGRTLVESQSSHNSPEPAEGRPPQDVRPPARRLSPPTTFPPAVVWAVPWPVLPDGEVGFLRAIQRGAKFVWFVCPHARHSARSSMQPVCENSPWAEALIAHKWPTSESPTEFSRA